MASPESSAVPAQRTLRPADFRWIRDAVAHAAGIRVGERKEPLVRARLAGRMRALGLDDFGAYVDRVREDASGREFWTMVEAIATHKTAFFRDVEQLEALRPVLSRALAQPGEVRIWSAGCSSGEEPYTLAMLTCEWHGEQAERVRILGTDLSRAVLARARAGRYGAAQIESVPHELRERYFRPAGKDGERAVDPRLRGMVGFARLNLIDAWPMRLPFHVILCRNVMIYFDRADSEGLCSRFGGALVDGGVLFTGRSEAPACPPGLELVRASLYRRAESP